MLVSKSGVYVLCGIPQSRKRKALLATGDSKHDNWDFVHSESGRETRISYRPFAHSIIALRNPQCDNRKRNANTADDVIVVAQSPMGQWQTTL